MRDQTEERYWTDYVRVATPIVGLLLLLGVFWYWASSLIGADSEEAPATTAASVTVIAAPTSTPSPTPEVDLDASTAVPTATEGAAEQPQPSPTRQQEEQQPTKAPAEAQREPTEEPAPGDYAEGEVVLSADDEVNMRAQPSTDADVLEVLALDQPLTVVDGQPQESAGIVWWNVRNEDSGNEGWVSEQWLKKQE